METLFKPEVLPGDYPYQQEATRQDAAIDLELIRKLSAGDQQALTELYRRYSSSLMSYLYWRTQRREIAEDLLQEVFLAVWQQAGRFEARSSFKTWIFRIAHNQAVSWLRKQKDTLSLDGDFAPDPVSVETVSLQNLHMDQIFDAMQSLGPKHRMAIELIFMYDFSYREAAEILGCPLGTVKSRVNHGLQQLNGLIRDLDTVDNSP